MTVAWLRLNFWNALTMKCSTTSSDSRSYLAPLRAVVCAASLVLGMPGTSVAAVTAGDLAVVGYSDYGPESTFSVAALDLIEAGTVLYFTNNGWNATNGTFYESGNGTGHGAQELLKLTVTSNLTPGRILRAGWDEPDYSWDYSGPITGGTGTFSMLSLNPGGDQIHIFTASSETNPLENSAMHLFQLDTGDFSNPFFEDAVSAATGEVAPGLSGSTAFMLPDPASGDDAADFHNGSFALNLSGSAVSALQFSGGTNAQWLSVIADSANWFRVNFEDDELADAESQLTALNVVVMTAPEPTRAVLMILGMLGVLFRRRR